MDTKYLDKQSFLPMFAQAADPRDGFIPSIIWVDFEIVSSIWIEVIEHVYNYVHDDHMHPIYINIISTKKEQAIKIMQI